MQPRLAACIGFSRSLRPASRLPPPLITFFKSHMCDYLMLVKALICNIGQVLDPCVPYAILARNTASPHQGTCPDAQGTAHKQISPQLPHTPRAGKCMTIHVVRIVMNDCNDAGVACSVLRNESACTHTNSMQPASHCGHAFSVLHRLPESSGGLTLDKATASSEVDRLQALPMLERPHRYR